MQMYMIEGMGRWAISGKGIPISRSKEVLIP